MTRSSVLVVVLIVVTGRATSRAAELPLHSVTGAVVKANAGLVILRPRLPSGQFGKAVVLKIRGTSRLTTLQLEVRDGQPVALQRALEPASLTPNRLVAAIYTIADGEEVLLTAAALPP